MQKKIKTDQMALIPAFGARSITEVIKKNEKSKTPFSQVYILDPQRL
jgi:hypothetical protein